MSNHLLTSTIFQLYTRQSEAELEDETRNEESFFNKYKWLIIGGLFAFVIQVLAVWWFLKRRRNIRARKQADEESIALAKAQTFGSVGVPVLNNGMGAGGNAWGVNPNQSPNANVWGVGGASRIDSAGGRLDEVHDVPPAYDGRRGQVERLGRGSEGGKI